MLWLIIVVLTQIDPQQVDIKTELKFTDRDSCYQFVYQNYDRLNGEVNKEYDQHKSTPNLFYCASVKRGSL